MVKLKAMITWTMEVDPAWYAPGLSPAEMAQVEEGAADFESLLIVGMEQADFKFTVEAVENG